MKHLVVIFENIGGYHAARLSAAQAAGAERGWKLTALQITNAQTEHPWGDLEGGLPFAIETALPVASTKVHLTDRGRQEAGRALAPLLERLAPDAVAIPGWGYAYSRAALASCTRRGRAAILMSESKRDDAPRSRWRELLKSLLYVRRFDAALVGGQAQARYLEELGFKAERIFFGYNAVDNAHFARSSHRARRDAAAARQREPLLPERPYFLAVTRLVPRKNVRRLIEAYARYRPTCAAPWDLAVCGSGEEETALRERIAALALERFVHLPGFLTYARISDWYGLSGAFIHPALQEQWGLVVNEAMASGLPVLVSNRCGCYPELVNNHGTGLGFDPASIDEMAAAMTRVAESPSLRKNMAEAAIRRIEDFSPAHFADGLMCAVEAATRKSR